MTPVEAARSASTGAWSTRRVHLYRIAAGAIFAAIIGVGARGMAGANGFDPASGDYAQGQPAGDVGSPDVYDQALTMLDGRSALPTQPPAELAYVILTVGNGEQVLRIQLEQMMILVCGPTPCGVHTTELRRFTLDGTEFRVLAAPLSKIATEPPAVSERHRSFWESVDFASTRPNWLTISLFPGGSGG